ncbi:diguanylate cyclase [Psychromonas ingrahamii 37]|uniref:Diguanylate cyclase n=1 Tax=Psychromonas ingrahamii (strain DSM 17664 / CCUG 51855 / 37) TaxID=357804 RepID=A1SYQ4_PSYIN|nr:GGDEF domain-containing protein [Psychromonas ingrahamii]ABM04619.1 diguanylate cyclase [Psychromonas ingrahamii 37]
MNKKYSQNFPSLSLTRSQVVFRIAGIVLVIEFMVMLIIGHYHNNLNIYAEAILDVALLTLFSTPFIFYWVIKPFVDERDVTLAELSDMAHSDPLTKLPNRRHLELHFDQFIAGSLKKSIRGALMLVDLDGFKLINDIYGHDAGDAVLIEVALRLNATVREEDIVSRLGGDEFVILIHHINSVESSATDTISGIAEKLVKIIMEPIDYKGNKLQVGASIGVRMLEFEEIDTETLIQDADKAMYHAKQAGKGRAVFFEEIDQATPIHN